MIQQKIKMKYLFTLILPLFFVGCGYSQNHASKIVFYNVENLFDTLDTPDKDDSEFLPGTKRDWNSDRYNEKLAHINQVIKEYANPLVIGLCEIENEQVVRDIVQFGELKSNYGVVHTESLDARGIDNAIIYDSSRIELEDHGTVRFEMPQGSSPSRDIVWAKFKSENEPFYVMVNHWPSRRGGQVESEPKRLIAAGAAKRFIDSLLTIDKKTQILFMGDLNDYPTDIAPQMIANLLKPMITTDSGKYGGSNNYRGEWNILDHIMVSPGFFKKKGCYVKKKSGEIGEYDYLLTEYKGNIVPFRTYGGGKYLKGYSDHLPVSIEVDFK